MITEEMLRKAAARSCEIYVAHLEKRYDFQNHYKFSPEFKKCIQDIKSGKIPSRLNILRRFIKRFSHHLFVLKRYYREFPQIVYKQHKDVQNPFLGSSI